MLSGSNTRPIFVALGTATILTLGVAAVPVAAYAAGSPSAAGDDPAPDPSDSPPASDPPASPPLDTPPPLFSPEPLPQSAPPYRPAPSLTIRLSLSATTAAPGGSVTATAKVSAQRAVARHAVVRFSASSASVGAQVWLGDLAGERSASSVVHIPAGHAKGSITVTATVSADRASTRSDSAKIKVAEADTAAAAVDAPGAGPPLAPSVPVPGLPGSAAALGGPAQAALPMIAPQFVAAPDRLPVVRPVSLRTKASPAGLDPTSYRLLWTQVAWLTALLVGVSLLLTQLRLNRRLRAARSGKRRRPSRRRIPA